MGESFDRRVFLGALGLTAGGLACAAPAPEEEFSSPHELPPLPYAADALEPHIDGRTMELHHDAHHGAYVRSLNNALAESPDLAEKPPEALLAELDAVPAAIRTAVRNHAGGHYNHSLFWRMMSPRGGGEPAGELSAAIDKFFGNADSLKSRMSEQGGSVFGSGWVWLTLDSDLTLRVETTANQDSPVSQGRIVLLGVDVWEHAYYLQYQNRRADYLQAFWRVVDWDYPMQRYADAVAGRQG